MFKQLRIIFAALFLIGAVALVLGLFTRPPRIAGTGLITPRTSVEFIADQHAVWLPDQCFNVHWKTDNIVSVTLDGTDKDPTGEEQICPSDTPRSVYSLGTLHTALSVLYRNGDVRNFDLRLEIIALNFELYALIGVALLMALFGVYLLQVPFAQNAVHALVNTLNVPAETNAAQLRLAWWMGIAFALINASFALIAAYALLAQPAWPIAPFVICGLALAGAGLIPAVQHRLSRLMQSNWLVLGPVAWFILSVIMLDFAMQGFDIPFWSAVQSWHALIFVWLAVFWLISYALRRFVLTPAKRFAWLSLASIAALVMIAALALPYLRWSYGWAVRVLEHQQNMPAYLIPVTDQNSDTVADYLPTTQNFPFFWRVQSKILHRPVFQMVTSQVCQSIDAVTGSYADGKIGCSLIAALIGHWLVNFAMYIVVLFLMLELVETYLHDLRVAWLAAALTAINVFVVWNLSIPSSDFADLFLIIGGLWLLHALFREPSTSPAKAVLIGILFGLMLLIKLLPLGMMLGVMLAVVLRRWRIVLALTVVPALVWLAYTRLVQFIDIPYYAVETMGHRSLVWLWTELPTYTPFEAIYSVAKSVGLAGQSTALLFGAVLWLGLAGALGDQRVSPALRMLGLAVFLCSAIFNWVFGYTYVAHTAILMPFLYGGAALAIDRAQTYLREHNLLGNPRRTDALALGIWAFAIIHNLVYWVLWTNRSSIPTHLN